MIGGAEKTESISRSPVRRTGGLYAFLGYGKIDKNFFGWGVTLSALMLALGAAECYNVNA